LKEKEIMIDKLKSDKSGLEKEIEILNKSLNQKDV
jgi:hypothetical protein